MIKISVELTTHRRYMKAAYMMEWGKMEVCYCKVPMLQVKKYTII